MTPNVDWIVEAGRVFRFGFIGVLATLICPAVTTFAIEMLDVRPWLGAVLGQAASFSTSYFGHDSYSFKVDSDRKRFLLRFLLFSVFAFVLSVGTTWILTTAVGLSYGVAVAVVCILIPATSCLCNRYWVFESGLQTLRCHPKRSAPVSEIL